MELNLDPARKQRLDDAFEVFSMLSGGNLGSVYDAVSRVSRFSRPAVELFGLPGEYVPDGLDDWSKRIHPDDRPRYFAMMERLRACAVLAYDMAYRVLTKDGRYGTYRAVGGVLRDEKGVPVIFGGKLVNEQMMEHTDPITLLRNQYGFFNDLPERMRAGKDCAILLIGVNNLNRINETFGYSHGNQVLQQIGWLVQQSTGAAGTVYRMDGAKYALVTTSMDREAVAELYERLRRKLQHDIRVGEVRHSISVSGGVILVRGLQMDARTVFSSLCFALMESRNRKHGGLVSFDGGVELDVASTVRFSVLQGCAGFSLHYQPVMSVATGRWIGVEAFVRWSGEPYGDVPPLHYLPVLEQDALFEELGNWILRRAMEDGARFVAADPEFLVGVNISPVQLEKDYFVENLLQLLSLTGFPARNLSLELNGDCRRLELPHVAGVVSRLKERGVRFLLDDFGKGNASLDFLRELRPDFVKLEPGLTEGLVTSDADRSAIRALSALASAYGSNVSVKHVERAETWELLRDYPIASVQGYLFSHPLPAEELQRRCFG